MLRRATPHGSDIQLHSLLDFPNLPDIVEDQETYAGNALKKAVIISAHTQTLVIADDSGLEVDALGGAPGVQSARYAGEGASDEDRIQKLLQALRDTPGNERTARFRCAVAVAWPSGENRVLMGTCEGHITRTPRGEHGFGYDPVFVPVGYDKTFAELGDTIKNKISHRARAFKKALDLLLKGDDALTP